MTSDGEKITKRITIIIGLKIPGRDFLLILLVFNWHTSTLWIISTDLINVMKQKNWSFKYIPPLFTKRSADVRNSFSK